MLESRGDVDLLQKPVCRESAPKLRPKDLDGHVPVMLPIQSLEHHSHPTGTHFSRDHVAIGKGRVELGNKFHRLVARVLAIPLHSKKQLAHAKPLGLNRRLPEELDDGRRLG